MILTREQIKSLASDTDDGFNLTLNEQDALCSTGLAYHDLRDAVTGLCEQADRSHDEYLRGLILDRFIVPSNVTVSRIRAVVARVERCES